MRPASAGGRGGAALIHPRSLPRTPPQGGDSCARGLFLGAALGAARGGDDAHAIPAAWLARLSASAELAALAAGIHEPVHGDASDHVEHVPRAAAH